MEDLSALSPAPVAIKQPKAPVVEVPVTAVMPQNKQDNLDLINISAESTPGKPEIVQQTTEKVQTPMPEPVVVEADSTAENDEQSDEEEQFEDARSTEQDEPAKIDCKASTSPKLAIIRPTMAVTSLTHDKPSAKDDKPVPKLVFVKPTNMVTSWDDDKPSATIKDTKKTAVKTSAPPPPTKKPAVTKKRSFDRMDSGTAKSSLVRSNSMRRSNRSVGGGVTPSRSRSQQRRSYNTPSVATKRTASADAPSSSSIIKRTSSADPAVPIKRKRRSSPAPQTSQPQKPKLTMPHTPRVLSRHTSKPGQSKFKSSEEIEMERIEQKRQETKQMLEISKKSKLQAMESVSYHPVRSVMEPTRPEEFRFETDSRIKEHNMETRQDKGNSSFASGLRKHKQSPKKQRGPTVTKPFHFSESHHRQNGGAAAAPKYKPMAQAINLFHSKTPDRFRTKATKDANKGPCPMKAVHSKPALTCPKTPALETRSRKRPVTAISQAEKDDMEYKEMKSYSFRARSIDPRVMRNMNVGVTKPQQKESTKAVGFDLECDKRFKEREANKKPQEEDNYEFHARPWSTKIMEGTVGIAPAKPMPVTCPKSPAFALKNRVRVTRTNTSQVEKEAHKIIHANPIPHMGVPFIPNLNHKVTESKPFSFENRDRIIQARKETKIQDMLNEEKELHNKFHAQPLPNHQEGRTKLPHKKRRSTTKPAPFASVEERGAKQAEQWSKKMEEELNEQRHQASKFKAKQATVLYEEPFVPQKSTRPLTDVSDFRLNTERRSVQRHDFEEKKHVRDANLRVADEERHRQSEEEEREAIARLRKEMEHKANPIRKFARMELLPSDRPLTQPESPHFETNMRLRSHERL